MFFLPCMCANVHVYPHTHTHTHSHTLPALSTQEGGWFAFPRRGGVTATQNGRNDRGNWKEVPSWGLGRRLAPSSPLPLMPRERKAPQLSAGEILSTQRSPRWGLPSRGSSWESTAGGSWGLIGRPGLPPLSGAQSLTLPRPHLNNEPGARSSRQSWEGSWEGRSRGRVLLSSSGQGMKAWSRGPPSNERTKAAASTQSGWKPGAWGEEEEGGGEAWGYCPNLS